MNKPLRRPVWPPLPRAAVVIPGHGLQAHSGAYSPVDGTTSYLCECGFQTVPAPPTTAAALRREHLETIMPKGKEPEFAPQNNAGKSILEIIWEEMDVVYARLMGGHGVRAKGDRGKASGLAYALAVLTNPYRVDVEAIREQAHERWEAGLDEIDLARYGDA